MSKEWLLNLVNGGLISRLPAPSREAIRTTARLMPCMVVARHDKPAGTHRLGGLFVVRSSRLSR